jgi:hypothetical protein
LIIWGISPLEIEQVVNLSNLIIWVGRFSFQITREFSRAGLGEPGLA